MLWLQTYIMWKIGSCFCTYEHVAHDSESNYAVLEENSLSHLHRCNSLDLYSIDVWSLILTFCKKKKKKPSVNMLWNVAFMCDVKHRPNMKQLIKSTHCTTFLSEWWTRGLCTLQQPEERDVCWHWLYHLDSSNDPRGQILGAAIGSIWVQLYKSNFF